MQFNYQSPESMTTDLFRLGVRLVVLKLTDESVSLTGTAKQFLKLNANGFEFVHVGFHEGQSVMTTSREALDNWLAENAPQSGRAGVSVDDLNIYVETQYLPQFPPESTWVTDFDRLIVEDDNAYVEVLGVRYVVAVTMVENNRKYYSVTINGREFGKYGLKQLAEAVARAFARNTAE